MKKAVIAAVFVMMSGAVLLAQSSASFTVEQPVLNAAGRPLQGSSAQSASYRISTDALGDGLPGGSAVSASYQLQSGFLPAFGPVGEVTGLRFANDTLLTWDLAANAFHYTVYRDDACTADALVTTNWSDGTVPVVGDVFFYLVTASNNVIEGSNGTASDGTPRSAGAACP